MKRIRRVARVALLIILWTFVGAAAAGAAIGAGFLHPLRRALTDPDVARAAAAFRAIDTLPENFEVKAPDGVLLRGWKIRPRNPNGDWVVLFHGVGDNRLGTLNYAK